jgi:hypothetical protein
LSFAKIEPILAAKSGVDLAEMVILNAWSLRLV